MTAQTNSTVPVKPPLPWTVRVDPAGVPFVVTVIEVGLELRSYFGVVVKPGHARASSSKFTEPSPVVKSYFVPALNPIGELVQPVDPVWQACLLLPVVTS